MSHCHRFVVVDFSAIATREELIPPNSRFFDFPAIPILLSASFSDFRSKRDSSPSSKVCVDLRVHRLRRNQAVYNANKYAKLVKQRVRLQNWFDYYVLKHQLNPHKKPTCRTGFLGLWGNKVDSIEYYQQQGV